jgi:hypothetical protein
MSSNNIILKKCKVCGKKVNAKFYDKSVYRPLCSRACYSEYINSLPKRYDKKLHHAVKEIKETKYEYYMKGILTLVNYKL